MPSWTPAVMARCQATHTASRPRHEPDAGSELQSKVNSGQAVVRLPVSCESKEPDAEARPSSAEPVAGPSCHQLGSELSEAGSRHWAGEPGLTCNLDAPPPVPSLPLPSPASCSGL